MTISFKICVIRSFFCLDGFSVSCQVGCQYVSHPRYAFCYHETDNYIFVFSCSDAVFLSIPCAIDLVPFSFKEMYVISNSKFISLLFHPLDMIFNLAIEKNIFLLTQFVFDG